MMTYFFQSFLTSIAVSLILLISVTASVADTPVVTLVKEINMAGESNPFQFATVEGTLDFKAKGEIGGDELWKSDGTTAGAVMVKDINPGGSSSPHHMTNTGASPFLPSSALKNSVPPTVVR